LRRRKEKLRKFRFNAIAFADPIDKYVSVSFNLDFQKERLPDRLIDRIEGEILLVKFNNLQKRKNKVYQSINQGKALRIDNEVGRHIKSIVNLSIYHLSTIGGYSIK